MRRLLGVVAGVAALFAIVFAVEAIGHSLFPPPGVDLADPEAMAGLMDAVPMEAKVAVVLAWLLGALGGAWVAIAVARWRMAGWIVAGIAIAGGVITLFMIPHPIWMQMAAVVAPVIGGWIATKLPLPGGRMAGA